MKITMLRNPARSLECNLLEGQTGEVDDKLAEQLVKAGIAVPAAETKKLEGKSPESAVKGK